ncbi:hypothetical protein FHX82_001573 [Amycolatopsis bartoniae]|nr:hypothetical protein [Amycolatopsis bartoniae]MBB2934553.1 hypothetical protein [Amycolatopsis bartoniae]
MRKRPGLAVATLALVLTLTGCGARAVSGTPSGDGHLFDNAQELVRAATGETDQVKSAKFSMTMTVAGQPVTGQGEGRFDGDNTAMRMSMTASGIDEEMLYVGKKIYLQVPEQYRDQLTSGKPWGQFPENSNFSKVMGAAQAQQNDPKQMLQQIQEAGTITRSAQETLDGKPATHYWIDVDVAKSVDKLAQSGLSQAQLQGMASKVKTVPMQLWLNEDLLPVQITEDMTELMRAAGAPASTQNMTLTMKYTDWGIPVDVQAPPADEVGDIELPN